MSKIIEEVRQITGNQVAKKQDVAKLNFPKIIEKVKAAANTGASKCTFPQTEINEYDKKLLVAEGFNVSLIDAPRTYGYDSIAQYRPQEDKIWEVRW